MKEEQKFLEEQKAMQGKGTQSAELEKTTMAELAKVRSDYESNKKTAIKHILDKVLDIDVSIPANLRQALLMGA